MQIKSVKIVSGVFAAIILGAIGSGIWEKILSPVLSVCSEAIINLISSISISYKNSIYSNAANGFHEKHSLTLLIWFLFAIVGLYCGMFLRMLIKKDKKVEKSTFDAFMSKSFFYIFAFLTLIVISMAAFMGIKENYTNKITTWSLRSIEILSFNISNETYCELKSSFYKIENAKDFYDFYEKLQTISGKYNVKIPQFDPL